MIISPSDFEIESISFCLFVSITFNVLPSSVFDAGDVALLVLLSLLFVDDLFFLLPLFRFFFCHTDVAADCDEPFAGCVAFDVDDDVSLLLLLSAPLFCVVGLVIVVLLCQLFWLLHWFAYTNTEHGILLTLVVIWKFWTTFVAPTNANWRFVFKGWFVLVMYTLNVCSVCFCQ